MYLHNSLGLNQHFLMENIILLRKNLYTKNIINSNPQHFCVTEDCLLLEGGILYGFTGLQGCRRVNMASNTITEGTKNSKIHTKKEKSLCTQYS